MLIKIRKAVDASAELRSKKALIETFIAGINDVEDVMLEWRTFVTEQKEKEIDDIISEQNLKPEETMKFIDNSFRDGVLKTTGTDIDKILPPTSLFSKNNNRKDIKNRVIEKLQTFFEKYFGLVSLEGE